MTFRDLANALRFDPEVQRRYDEAIERMRRAYGVHSDGPSIAQVLEAWYRRHGR